MHADPLLQILILLTASVGVVALVRRLNDLGCDVQITTQAA